MLLYGLPRGGESGAHSKVLFLPWGASSSQSVFSVKFCGGMQLLGIVSFSIYKLSSSNLSKCLFFSIKRSMASSHELCIGFFSYFRTARALKIFNLLSGTFVFTTTSFSFFMFFQFSCKAYINITI